MNRCLLFIPGNNPGMLLNADIHYADSIIIDLEDAVTLEEKDSARILVRNAIKTLNYNTKIIVRVNQLNTEFFEDDLKEIIPLNIFAILLPKTNSKEDVLNAIEHMKKINNNTKTKIIPLIETALGVENAFSISSCSSFIDGVLLGAEDLTADMQSLRTKESNEIFYSRTRVVSAARACGVNVYDTPFTDTNDETGVIEDAQKAKQLGFSGKAVISPRHVSHINNVFSPSKEDVAYAMMVLEAIEDAKKLGKGAVSLHGKMIDAPIVNRAKQVLEINKKINGGN
ncbi:MAG: HpcH/HpaI aldolase/citrate lyase family protein [Oscillospiraceae bacterium]